VDDLQEKIDKGYKILLQK